jgi:hypothetical protein
MECISRAVLLQVEYPLEIGALEFVRMPYMACRYPFGSNSGCPEKSLRARSDNPTHKRIGQDWNGSKDILTYLEFNPTPSAPIQPVSNVTERALKLCLSLCRLPSGFLFEQLHFQHHVSFVRDHKMAKLHVPI